LTGVDGDPFLLKNVLQPPRARDMSVSGESLLRTPWKVILITNNPENLKKSEIISILKKTDDSKK
jgi:hypothetical protein